jgi:hypothetical protein
MMTFIEDGVIVQGRAMNAAEKAERKQWAKDAADVEQVEADRVAAKQAAKESAHTKLAKLGLTTEEIAAIITP